MDPLPKSTGLQMDNGQLSFNCDKFNKIKDENELHDALDPEVSGSPQVDLQQPEGPGTPEAPESLSVDSLQPEGPGTPEALVSPQLDLQRPECSGTPEAASRSSEHPDATDESDEESDDDIPDIQADEIPDSSNSVEAQPELNQTEDAVDSLLAAVAGGNFLDVQRWLSHPASEGFEQLGAALEQAVQMDWVPVVYQLLELGAAEATGDAEFQSRLLTEAIRLGHLAAAEALIRGPGRRGGGCCQLGETSLILAVQPGASLQFVKAFADDGEDVNATDLHGRTALSYAAQHGLCDIVRWLCTCARASRNIADTMEWTPINYAIWALENLPDDCDADRQNLSEVIDILDNSVDK